MRVDGRLVLVDHLLFAAVGDAHDVDVFEIRPAFAPVAVRHDVMPSDFAAGLNFAARRHSPVVERVEFGHAFTRLQRLDVFEKGGKTADDFFPGNILVVAVGCGRSGSGVCSAS